ncbi:hypothetical protein T4B_4407, partial [Trichinella pseudospiralis]
LPDSVSSGRHRQYRIACIRRRVEMGIWSGSISKGHQ